MAFSARHVLVDCRNCNGIINDSQAVHDALVEATGTLDVRVIDLRVRSFQPQGITAVAILAESHFSIHTWPECRYLAADFFTCGKPVPTHAAVEVLRRYFKPEHIEVREIDRGCPEVPIDGPMARPSTV